MSIELHAVNHYVDILLERFHFRQGHYLETRNTPDSYHKGSYLSSEEEIVYYHPLCNSRLAKSYKFKENP